MSILVGNIRLALEASEQDAFTAARKKCELPANAVHAAHIYRSSIDARRGRITRVLSVLLELENAEAEAAVVQRMEKPDVRLKKPVEEPVPVGTERLTHRPIVVGFGPGGLFAAYVLAKNGYRPLVIERGQAMDSRQQQTSPFLSMTL